MSFKKLMCFTLFMCLYIIQIKAQTGPDPWNFESKLPEMGRDDIPPDLRIPVQRKLQAENKPCIGEWFFKRTLAIVLKGGASKVRSSCQRKHATLSYDYKFATSREKSDASFATHFNHKLDLAVPLDTKSNKNEDGSVDIALQMKLNPKQWETLDEALKSTSPLSEDTFRRSVAYVEESICKPSVVEQMVLTWSEYFTVYLAEYKIYITWAFGFLAFTGGSMWVRKHTSHKHAIVLLFVIFYAYEVVISYKEAESKELDEFLTAVNKCKWYFWTSDCEVPPPDPLVFLKHMNPLKIGIRMFTSALAEPFIVISGTVETILHGVTDGLWYPFDKIMYGILAVVVNISLIFLLVLILFNWLLNIPFSLSLFGIGLSVNSNKSRRQNSPKRKAYRIKQSDGVSQATLDKILNVCSLALSSNPQTMNKGIAPSPGAQNMPKIRRSASTGRLPNMSFKGEFLALKNTARRRNIGPRDGSGDA